MGFTLVESLDEYGNPISTIGEYFYDGDGKRVKKVVPSTGETTVFVYDASGKLAAEYSTIVETQNPKVSYLTADHLGSPRITTDENGQVISRRDFQPFGEEIATSQRTQGLGYAGDTVRQKFTSYERDKETDLDFAQARMYSKNLGRFTTVDPYNINLEKQYAENYDDANQLLLEYITKPLRWNRYVYTLNNPLNYVDPDGERETAHVNIVYDKETIGTEEKAKKLTEKIVADAIKVYKAAGIDLVITYSAGNASSNSALGDNKQKITEGKVNGALNVFISNDLDNLTGGKSNTDSGESFINYGRGVGTVAAREPDEGLLSHEIGHQFGYSAAKFGDLTAESLVENANDALRNGRTTITEYVPPVTGRNSTQVPQPRRTGYITKELPAIAVYRNGAKRFEYGSFRGH
jgi:RHS repeat-associated protein